MTTVVTLASRRAAPISTTTQANELHLIQLHAPTTADGTSTWAKATARATRGLSALKQTCALSNRVEG